MKFREFEHKTSVLIIDLFDLLLFYNGWTVDFDVLTILAIPSSDFTNITKV